MASFPAGSTEGVEEKKVPAVPEILIKLEEIHRERSVPKEASKGKEEAHLRKSYASHKEYRWRYKTAFWRVRMARKAGDCHAPAGPKLALVLRIRSLSGVSPESERCCSSFASASSPEAPLLSSVKYQLIPWGLWTHLLHGVPESEVSRELT